MSCKYFLVPQDILDRWQQDLRTKRRNNPGVVDTEEADRGVQDLISTSKMSDYEKLPLLEDRMTRLLAAKNHEGRTARAINPTLLPPNPPTRPGIDFTLLPPTQRGRATSLLRLWENNPSLGWDSKHQLEVGGRAVEGSNMHDLLKDAVSTRKSAPAPIGFKELLEASRESNVPTSLFSNDRWLAAQSAAQLHPETPLAPILDSTPSAPRRKRGPAAKPIKTTPRTTPTGRSGKKSRLRMPTEWHSLE